MQTIDKRSALIYHHARKQLATRRLNIVEFIRALELPYELESWQYRFLIITCDPRNYETLHVRSRGGSKTFDIGLIVGLYFAYLGFGWRHYVAQFDMIKQPQQYLGQIVKNCFLLEAVSTPIREGLLKRSVNFKNGGFYELMNATEGTGRSRRLDGAYLDEEREMDPDVIGAIKGTLSNSLLAKLIHGSTPAKGGPFEENFLRMKRMGLPIMIRAYDEIGFINQHHIDTVIRPTIPNWFFLQEYKCVFVAPEGAVFTNIIQGDFTSILEGQKSNYARRYVHAGLDWNPSAGHYLVGTRWSDDLTKIFVIFEKNLGTDLNTVMTTIIDLLTEFPMMKLEIEDGGTNMGYCDALFGLLYKMQKQDLILHTIIKRVFRIPWDSQGVNKHRAITNLMPVAIYYDERITPKVAYWLERAHWDKKAMGEPKLEKDPDQHPFDSFLHASRQK